MKDTIFSRTILGMLVFLSMQNIAHSAIDNVQNHKDSNFVRPTPLEIKSTANAGSWHDLGDVTLTDYTTPPEGSARQCGSNSSYGLCAYTGARVNAGPAAKHNILVTGGPVTQVISGKSFVFSGYFSDGTPILYTFIKNQANGGGQDQKTSSPLLTQYANAPGGSTNFPVYYDGTGLGCGNAAGGCMFSATTFFTKASLKAAVQIPANITAGTYEFKNVEILRIHQETTNPWETRRGTTDAVVTISGAIKLPNRCFISTMSDKTLDFGEIKANVDVPANKIIETKDFTFSTRCEGLLSDVSFNIQVGDTKESLKMIGGKKSFGFATKILTQENSYVGSPDCQGNGHQFGREYYIRTIPKTQTITKQDKIRFSLCKLGTPESLDIGPHAEPIKLYTRWYYPPKEYDD